MVPRTLAPWLLIMMLFARAASPGAAAAEAPGDTPPSGVDAIVLLAGEYQLRTEAAARLYRQGISGRILLTDDRVRRGWSPRHQRNLYAIERTEEELVRLGVPATAVTRLPFVRSGTIYDALAARRFFREHGLRSMLLVTSDYHVERAAWAFRRVLDGTGIRVFCHPAPSRAGFVYAHLAEKLKFAFYLLRYGLFPVPGFP